MKKIDLFCNSLLIIRRFTIYSSRRDNTVIQQSFVWNISQYSDDDTMNTMTLE